jgi:hypothetical protein
MDEPKWWESTSEFNDWLSKELLNKNCHFEEFIWSGANSDRERLDAARNLAKFFRSADLVKYDEIHVIAHSHGGNVVELAFNDLNQPRLSSLFKEPIRHQLVQTVVTVGTPYFQTKVPLLRRLGQIGSILAIPGGILVGYVGYVYRNNPPFGPGLPSSDTYYNTLRFFLITSLLCLVTAIPCTWEFLRSTRLTSRDIEQRPNWLAISHTSDEAIATLKAADNEKLVLFEARTLRKSIQNSVISIGILLFAASLVVGVLMLFWELVKGESLAETTIIFAPAVIVAAALPVLWIAVFGILFLLAPALAAGANKMLNSRIHGFALGQDHHANLDDVTDIPHTINSERLVLGGVWHDDMLESAQLAMKLVIEKNHSQLFRVDLSTHLKNIFGRLDADDFFDGLIHTSYFSHQQLATKIAAHIGLKTERLNKTDG